MSIPTRTIQDVLNHLSTTEAEANKEIVNAGIPPDQLKDISVIHEEWILGIKASDFIREHSTLEFDFTNLVNLFKVYCKDYDLVLDDKPSKALEFSARILFEYGPKLRQEKKGKGDKAIRIKFPYMVDRPGTADATSSKFTSVRTVIVSTFKDHPHVCLEEKNAEGQSYKKLVITSKQATVLATSTFLRTLDYEQIKTSTVTLMTPLCGAIFSKESIKEVATKLKLDQLAVAKIMNASTCPSGHYLADSDMACAIVATIAGTKNMQNKGARDQMIAKVVKQYTAKKKMYHSERFEAFAEFALGGVPPGLDSGTLIDAFKSVQIRGRKKE